MSLMILEIPYPPSVNHYYRNVKGKTLISAEGRAYRKSVYYAVQDQAPVVALAGRIEVSIVAHPPDRRRRDLDNTLKACLDSLEKAGLYEDDSQIDKLTVIRGAVCPGGKLSVEIIER